MNVGMSGTVGQRPWRSGASRGLGLASAMAIGLLACVGAQGSDSDTTEAPREVTGNLAFVGVDVLTMQNESVLSNQTVVIDGQTIVAVGPAGSIEVPDGAQVVDGTGRFLMPGLAEMHAHIPGGNAPQDEIEDILFLYVANGVTTIRGMLGAPNQLELRERTASGDLLGPTIYVGAPSINGNSAPNPESAERLIREHAEAGYDFQKIHPGVSRETWDHMVAVAREVGFTYAGHVPQDVGIEHALRTDLSTVDHLDGYLQGALSDELTERLAADLGVIPTSEIMAGVDWDRVAEFVALTAETSTYQVPTLYLWENFYEPLSIDSMLALPEMQYMPPQYRQGWARQKRNRPEESAEVAESVASSRLRLLSMLNEAGVPMLMGTDSPQMFNVPGFALHRELRIMGEAMSPYEVLRSGTANVASYVQSELGLDGSFGTVAEGMRADLILLNGNPLESLETVSDRAGVVVLGRWVPEEEIQAGLTRLAEKYGG